MKEQLNAIAHAVFRDAEGNILREDSFDNLVTTAGKNYLLDYHVKYETPEGPSARRFAENELEATKGEAK